MANAVCATCKNPLSDYTEQKIGLCRSCLHIPFKRRKGDKPIPAIFSTREHDGNLCIVDVGYQYAPSVTRDIVSVIDKIRSQFEDLSSFHKIIYRDENWLVGPNYPR
jgi:hypothetical protein